VCVCDDEGESSGEIQDGMVVSASQCLFYIFFVCESKRESKRDYSPLESGFWGTQAQESVNLASLRGAAVRGVLGGLIRRMLSHHPSRQAGENWLAPRRVEFTGGGGGGGRMWSGALDTCHSLWSVSGSQQQINKISFLLPFTCRGSSPSRRSFSQLALAL